MSDTNETTRELRLLEHIENDPDTTQATLATQLGVAVGTVNWHLKRMVQKGYVKVKRAERRKLKYIITAEGIAFRARLTVDYIEQSFKLYRLIRERVQASVDELKQNGYQSARIDGEGDIADVCRLTCMEQGIEVETLPTNGSQNKEMPTLIINGLKIHIQYPLKGNVPHDES
jgi:DNA-binding MarR family transcriptional regulator